MEGPKIELEPRFGVRAVGLHPKIELGPRFGVRAVEPYPKTALGPPLSPFPRLLSGFGGHFLRGQRGRLKKGSLSPPAPGGNKAPPLLHPPLPKNPRHETAERGDSQRPLTPAGPGGTRGDCRARPRPAGAAGLAGTGIFHPKSLVGLALIPLPPTASSGGSRPCPGVPALPGGPSPAQTRIRLNKR